MQAAAGTFFFLTLARLFLLFRAPPFFAHFLSSGAYPSIGPLIGLGGLSALFHLGSPQGGLRALRNWRTSWLSREVIFALLFSFDWVLLVIALLMLPEAAGLHTALSVLGSLFGISLVYSMARLYRLRTVPTWDTSFTTISFFSTSILLGSLFSAAAFSFAWLNLHPGQFVVLLSRYGLNLELFLRFAAVLAFASVALELTLLTLSVYRSSSPPALLAGPQTPNLPFWILLRIVFTLSGAGILLVLLISEGIYHSHALLLAAGAFLPLLISQIIGRWLFYRRLRAVPA